MSLKLKGAGRAMLTVRGDHPMASPSSSALMRLCITDSSSGTTRFRICSCRSPLKCLVRGLTHHNLAIVSAVTKTPFESSPIHSHVSFCDLVAKFRALNNERSLGWITRLDNLKLLGRGGQGMVYRSESCGADGFRKPIALKVFSPEVYVTPQDYETDMGRIARVASRVAGVQHDHLMAIHNFVEHGGIRVMLMEWVDGYDLRQLLGQKMLSEMRSRIDRMRWTHLNDVVIAEGPVRSRLKPGICIQILRECLIGLASLHRAGLAHGDIKPDNIMLKRSGNVKLVDFGSTVDLRNSGSPIGWTPTYAAPEVLEGAMNSPQSDLASLGYVFLEMLSGTVLFDHKSSLGELLKAKQRLPGCLHQLLPPDVLRDGELTELCRILCEPDPHHRVSSAEEANLEWAVNVHRRLVKTGLDSDYENDIRIWMEALPPKEEEAPVKPLVPANDAAALGFGDSTVLVGGVVPA